MRWSFIIFNKKTMRNLSLIFLVIGITACHKQYQPADPYPIYLISEKEWIVYEGVLPLDDSLYTVELKLKPGSIGENSYFQFRTFSPDKRPVPFMNWYGRDTYQVLYGSQDKRVIQLTIQNVVFKGKNKKPEIIAKEIFFQTVNDHELVLLDNDLEVTGPFLHALQAFRLVYGRRILYHR